jgi:hypothetical protein
LNNNTEQQAIETFLTWMKNRDQRIRSYDAQEYVQALITGLQQIDDEYKTTNNKDQGDSSESLIKDGIRFRWLIENLIEYKPPGYDGNSHGRYDLFWVMPISDIRVAIDEEIEKDQ